MKYTAKVMKQSKRFPREIQLEVNDDLFRELYYIGDEEQYVREDAKDLTYKELSELCSCGDIEFKVCCKCPDHEDVNSEEYNHVLVLYQVWCYQDENIFDVFCKAFGLWLNHRNLSYSVEVDKEGMTFNIESQD